MEATARAAGNDAAAASSQSPALSSATPQLHATTTATDRVGSKRDADGDEPMESPRDAAEPPRWSRDEHARFMQALEAYGGESTGDEWRKIAAFVQTRSLDEVRLHGQQYLQHLVQIHHLQQAQQQHLQQQQQRLLQLSRMGYSGQSGQSDALSFPLSSTHSSMTQNNQNDPNGPNSSSVSTLSARAKAPSATDTKGAAMTPTTSTSALSAAAQSVAYAMNARVLVRPSDAQPVVVRKSAPPVGSAVAPASTSSTRGKPKSWSFQEDKVLETALAAWQRGKPYSWPKIAGSLPGKTAKDVRLRYEQLVEDVASIDKSGSLAPRALPLPPKIPTSIAIPSPRWTASTTTAPASLSSSTSSSSSSLTPVSGRPPTHAGLSSRIAPPPPIQVPPPPLSTKAKTESPGIFPGSARGRFAMTPSFGGASGMLSPTFLDFLASEDKPPMPAFAGLTDLPSSLLLSPMGLDLHTPSGARGRRSFVTPRGSATPRIWHDFLADDFKFDPKATAASDATTDKTVEGDAARRSDHVKTE